MADRPVWDRDGRDWPNRDSSRFLAAGGLRWHVQQMGAGPVLLLVHGTGAATHSWRGLAPLLARRFTVVAPDLPGHGFTEASSFHRLSLPRMARLLAALLRSLDMSPDLALGHSAGAAILARMALDGQISPRLLISVNGALLPFDGVAGHLFPALAKLLFLNPVTPRLFAWGAADRARVERLLRDTGSRIDPEGVDLYARLFRRSGHVAATLGMMASWDLAALERDLPRLDTRLVLITGENDQSISPHTARAVRNLVPKAELVSLPGLGHLAHEERPDQIADLVTDRAMAAGVLAAA